MVSYEKAADYWAKIPATIDGVLGGYGHLTECDIKGSKIFLNLILSLENAPSRTIAVDCGAGIGRISKFLLIPQFAKVDLVEQDHKFLSKAEEFIGPEHDRLGTLYPVGLQHFKPDKKYDLIWNQWVLGHLNDEDLVSYLNRCRDALAENGVIIVKENVTSSGTTERDDIDFSVTRGLKNLLKIFKQAKLRRIKQSKQTNFPNGIYPVYMFALRPSLENNGCNNLENQMDELKL